MIGQALTPIYNGSHLLRCSFMNLFEKAESGYKGTRVPAEIERTDLSTKL